MNVVVTIVNFKVAQLTIESLASLKSEVESAGGVKVIVVDNDSQDGSFEKISASVVEFGWSNWVEVVASPKNGGFAYGNNVGIKYAEEKGWGAKYYWFLNPDTKVYPGALTELVSFMESTPKSGICGSSILNEDGSLWPICFNFPGVLSEFERGVRLGVVTKLLSRWKVPQEMKPENAKVDWLPGASFLIRKEVFDDIGFLDDGYFLYYEETDFCLNAFRAGWSCWYVPASKIMHIAGASTGVVDQKTEQKPLPQYMFDSRSRYFTKNHGFLYACLADMSWLLGYGLNKIRTSVTGKSDDDPKNLFSDSFKNAVFIKKLFG